MPVAHCLLRIAYCLLPIPIISLPTTFPIQPASEASPATGRDIEVAFR